MGLHPGPVAEANATSIQSLLLNNGKPVCVWFSTQSVTMEPSADISTLVPLWLTPITRHVKHVRPVDAGRTVRVLHEVETAGIEPASAVAQEVASTSVSGALISSPARLAGGVAGNQLRKVVLGVGRSGPIRASLLVDPGSSAAGRLEARSAHGLVTKRRARTRESPHLLFSRVFYEASRDLDSQPPPRTDHVEACRPRGLCLITSSIRPASAPTLGSRPACGVCVQPPREQDEARLPNGRWIRSG